MVLVMHFTLETAHAMMSLRDQAARYLMMGSRPQVGLGGKFNSLCPGKTPAWGYVGFSWAIPLKNRG